MGSPPTCDRVRCEEEPVELGYCAEHLAEYQEAVEALPPVVCPCGSLVEDEGLRHCPRCRELRGGAMADIAAALDIAHLAEAHHGEV
jgi:tRNA(Ile)-lysidine synthase TilS/MesJ